MNLIFYAVKLNAMKNFSSTRVILLGISLLASQHGVTANETNCQTPKLGPSEPLLITIFDNKRGLADADILNKVCEAIRKFPKGLITLEYRPGSLATGDGDNIQCGSGDCKADQLLGCLSITSKNYTDCFADTVFDVNAALMCYCNKGSNGLLLENSKLRADWKVPENAIPTMAVNKAYDPCIKFGSTDEIMNYLCQVYQKQVGSC